MFDSVALGKDVARFIRGESGQRKPLETGGILIGLLNTTCLRISLAAGPGPNAKHGRASFTRDGEFAQEELEKAWARSGGAEDYVGEWHSHPLPFGPSPLDRRSMAAIARNPAYAQPDPLMILCVADGWSGKSGWSIQAYALRNGQLKAIKIEDER